MTAAGHRSQRQNRYARRRWLVVVPALAGIALALVPGAAQAALSPVTADLRVHNTNGNAVYFDDAALYATPQSATSGTTIPYLQLL